MIVSVSQRVKHVSFIICKVVISYCRGDFSSFMNSVVLSMMMDKLADSLIQDVHSYHLNSNNLSKLQLQVTNTQLIFQSEKNKFYFICSNTTVNYNYKLQLLHIELFSHKILFKKIII